MIPCVSNWPHRRLWMASWIWISSAACAAAAPSPLPPEFVQKLGQAGIPLEAVSVWVQTLDSPQPDVVWNEQLPRNPASLMKLLTTSAALDLLGPNWTWQTPVWIQGEAPTQGQFKGQIHIRGQGDPKLVMERLWLLMRKIRQWGIQHIQGDIVLDRRSFDPGPTEPGEFDGESARAYNVQADALLLNYKSIVLSFTPDPDSRVARVMVDPPLQDFDLQTTVPLVAGECEDWRTRLRADVSALKARFSGGYVQNCGEKAWPMAYAEPASFHERALKGMWTALGGTLSGTVKSGPAPDSPPTFAAISPPLAEVVRDINKHSNNVMAQQTFLTLGWQMKGHGSVDLSRQVLQEWAQRRLGDRAKGLVVDNGSGLSRHNRVTAALLAQLLDQSAHSGTGPELMSSLPIAGVDGTMRRSKAPMGMAHLKTGTLKDVAGVAGYVLHADGRRSILVAIVNHPQAPAARPAMDSLIAWTRDRPKP